MNFKRKAPLQLPVLSFKDRTDPYYVRINDEIHVSKIKDPNAKKDNPAEICTVTNLEDGQQYTMVCSAVLSSTLKESGDYVGKCFEITLGDKPAGKEYRTATVWEIEDPEKGAKA